jgi:hypothetical protein
MQRAYPNGKLIGKAWKIFSIEESEIERREREREREI